MWMDLKSKGYNDSLEYGSVSNTEESMTGKLFLNNWYFLLSLCIPSETERNVSVMS